MRKPLRKISTENLTTSQEAAQYIGMSRSFLRQNRMNGLVGHRIPGPPPGYFILDLMAKQIFKKLKE